jgi:hypothetical protein
MKIKLTRAYSQKIQLKEFEPIESFCSIEAEIDQDEMIEKSRWMDGICQAEVTKTIVTVQAEKNSFRGKPKIDLKEVFKDKLDEYDANENIEDERPESPF